MNHALQLVSSRNSDSVYSQMKSYYDFNHELIWCYMHGKPRPCFTSTLLHEINLWLHEVAQEVDTDDGNDIQYLVSASKVPGIFSLGGDLDFFSRLIGSRNRQGLYRYMKACIDVLHSNATGLNRNITTISLVQGKALGGGFETALSSHVLIAERSARMGFPEILFNLFPGMGAYSFLSRKLDGSRAERLMLSGKIMTAEELYEMGVVDVLAEDGEGEKAVYDYIKRENRAKNGFRAVRAVRERCNPVSYDELMDIGQIWVDTAMKLTDRDLRMMHRLVSRQTNQRYASV